MDSLQNKLNLFTMQKKLNSTSGSGKLTWLVLGGDSAARSHRIEQFTAFEACNALGASDGIIHSRISHEAVSLRASANVVGSTLSDLNAQGLPDICCFLDLLPNCLHGWASCLRYEKDGI